MASWSGVNVTITIKGSWEYHPHGHQNYQEWFDTLGSIAMLSNFHRKKFILEFNGIGFARLVGRYHDFYMPHEVYNAIAPLYTFNPVTEKYEGKFTLLQIWEYLL